MGATFVRRDGQVFRAAHRLRQIRLHRPRQTKLPAKRIRAISSLSQRIHNDRTFNMSLHGSSAIEYPTNGLRRLESDASSLIVAVDGSCSRNGQLGARAGYGTFFSSANPLMNASGLVPASSPQTSQYAELYATMKALDTVHELIISGEDLTHVIIKTDSEYLVKGLSRWVWKWMRNGFRNVRGQPVVNGRAFKYLHERVELLEREYGVVVSFCLVGRQFNLQADRLAKGALSLMFE